MTARELHVARLGRTPYVRALELQRELARARITGAIEQDLLLLVEHPPVVTLGRSSKARHLTTPAPLLAARGVELFEVERGGDVTFHGPGQLVGYPIVDLKRHRRDLHWYLRQVEEALIGALAELGVAGERSAGYTGVWTTGRSGAANDGRPLRKLASIGVHARDWVTWHGFALNVSTELSFFDLIVPCGIAGVEMTSIAHELEAPVEPAQVEAIVARAFGRVFELAPVDVELSALMSHAGAAGTLDASALDVHA